jgi:polar amino acid transport system permease protein
MRLSANPVLRSVSAVYIWFFRSVPPLLQLLFWFQMASLYPQVSLGIPFLKPFVTIETAHLFSGLLAAFVGLTFDIAAFAAEIIRGGLVSVEAGQTEAAKALGLSKTRIFWRIVLPQAMPAIIPASGNLLIGLLKGTSIVSVIAVQDLLYSVQLIYAQNYLVIPLLLVATIWYLILVTILSTIQFFVERHYARGKGARSGFWQLWRGQLPLVPRLRPRRDLEVLR